MSTLAEEVKNPAVDMPVGIVGCIRHAPAGTICAWRQGEGDMRGGDHCLGVELSKGQHGVIRCSGSSGLGK